MKKLSIIFLLFTVTIANAQRKTVDSLRAALNKQAVDTVRLGTIIQLGDFYFLTNPDSSILFGQEAYLLASKYNRPGDIAQSMDILAVSYATIGDFPKAMQFYYKARAVYEKTNDVSGIVTENDNIGATYVVESDYTKALTYLQLADKQWRAYTPFHQLKTFDDKTQQETIDINIAECYLYTHRINLAEQYLEASYKEFKDHIAFQFYKENIERDFGEVELERGNKPTALKHLRTAVALSIADHNVEMLSISYLSTAKLYHKFSQPDSAAYYAEKALNVARDGKYEQDVINAGKALYTYYDEQHNLPQAYKYFKLTTAAKDSLYSQGRLKQLLSIDFDEKQRQQDIAAAQLKYEDQVRTYLFIAGLVILLLVMLIIWRNSKQKNKANKLLQKQKEDIESALSQLQLTQKQLIQSEKMASLGELTAGIAHEIQNPLNFINNFSEVNIELAAEMREELKMGNTEDVVSIIDDIEQNLQKVLHHGKRADNIVKGMLQHSRTGSTIKEITDLNVLTDEYLRLSYHGLRAKDKSFNADLVTNYAKNLPPANVLPQDIGRVLLNLFTNAFYAVNQKKQTAGDDYKPTVEVSTATEKGNIVITVTDNGTGMPEHVKDKIMQPFFTTKPTGQGTGLGLSLSYDIVVKGHNGVINVDTKENEYTTFTITLPL